MLIVLGIDNGFKGAITVLNEKRELLIHDIPTITEKRGKSNKQRYDDHAVADILRKYAKKNSLPDRFKEESIVGDDDYIIAYVEQATPRPAQKHGSPQGNFQTGYGSALFKTILRIFEIPFEEVDAKIWQKHFFKALHGNDDTKSMSVETARRLFPTQQSEFSGPRGGVKDGRSDAALIAEYGLRKQLGKTAQEVEEAEKNITSEEEGGE